MGFALVAPRKSVARAIEVLARHGLRSSVVGRIVRGSGVVQIRHKLKYTRY
jgi:phosphoribosylaminoimidazole (AIR) synthetase